MKLGLASLLIAALSCASGANTPVPALSLRLKLMEGSLGPVAIFHFANDSTVPIGLSPTFVFEDQYLFLIISGENGRITYPLTSQYELFSPPPYRCLNPQEKLTVKVPLKAWYPVLGGQVRPQHDLPQKGPHSFSLPSGHYRIKAVYFADDSEVSGSCRAFRGMVESPWYELIIE